MTESDREERGLSAAMAAAGSWKATNQGLPTAAPGGQVRYMLA